MGISVKWPAQPPLEGGGGVSPFYLPIIIYSEPKTQDLWFIAKHHSCRTTPLGHQFLT